MIRPVGPAREQPSSDGDEALSPDRIGAVVRQARLAMGLSPTQLADAAMLHKSTIGRLERGQFRPERKTLLSVLRVLSPGLQRTQPPDILRLLAAPSTRGPLPPLATPASADAPAPVPSLPGLSPELTLDALTRLVRAKLPQLRAATFDGDPGTVLSWSADALAVFERHKGTLDPHNVIAVAYLRKERALALLEYLSITGYEAVLDAAWAIQSAAVDMALPRWKGDRLWKSGDLCLGIAVRILEERLTCAPDPALAALLDHALSDYNRHPLEEAADTQDPADRIWAYIELAKLYILRRSVQKAEEYLRRAQRERLTNDVQVGADWVILDALFDEALIILLLSKGDLPAAAKAIERARESSLYAVNAFRLDLARCRLLGLGYSITKQHEAENCLERLRALAPTRRCSEDASVLCAAT